VSLVGALLVAAMESVGGDTGIVLAPAFGLLFRKVSAPLHVGLAAASMILGVLRGPRCMAWVHAYPLANPR